MSRHSELPQRYATNVGFRGSVLDRARGFHPAGWQGHEKDLESPEVGVTKQVGGWVG